MPKRHDEAGDAILARIMGQRRSVRDFSREVLKNAISKRSFMPD